MQIRIDTGSTATRESSSAFAFADVLGREWYGPLNFTKIVSASTHFVSAERHWRQIILSMGFAHLLHEHEVFQFLIKAAGMADTCSELGEPESSLPRAIDRLERELGTIPFLTSSSGLVATENAHALHQEVDRLYASLGALQDMLRDGHGPKD